MKLDNLLDKNGGGLSFKNNGNSYIPAYFKTGYFVAITDNEITANKRRFTVKLIRELAKQLCLKQFYYGYWQDSKTKLEYLDLSLHIANKQEALSLAKTFNQKAIFDCNKLESIYL